MDCILERLLFDHFCAFVLLREDSMDELLEIYLKRLFVCLIVPMLVCLLHCCFLSLSFFLSYVNIYLFVVVGAGWGGGVLGVLFARGGGGGEEKDDNLKG